MSKLNCVNKEGVEKIDRELCDKINVYENVDQLADSAFSCVTLGCNIAFGASRGAKDVINNTNNTQEKEIKLAQLLYPDPLDELGTPFHRYC
jgi:hypothetical protein